MGVEKIVRHMTLNVICLTIRSSTLIWVLLERSFSPAEVEYRWCQFWSKFMMSEVEERPTLVTAGYGWH